MTFLKPALGSILTSHSALNFKPDEQDYPLYFYNAKLANELGLQDTDGSLFANDLFSYLRSNPILSFRYIIETIYGRSEAGDGRSGLVADIETAKGKLEINLKGCGPNELTRTGYDGHYSLFESIREVLGSEYLAAQNIPTTRVLAVFKGPHQVSRKFDSRPNNSALIVRVANSFFRVGNLQYLAQQKERSQIFECIRFLNERLQFSPRTSEKPGIVFCENVIRKSAQLLSGMTFSGFIHGTLNTSHMTISGESIDHGAYAVTPVFSDQASAKVFDPLAISSFGQQPKTFHWLLSQLIAIFRDEPEFSEYEAALKKFKTDIRSCMVDEFFARKNLTKKNSPEDAKILIDSLSQLKLSQESMAHFFSYTPFSADDAEALLSGPDEQLQSRFLHMVEKLQGGHT